MRTIILCLTLWPSLAQAYVSGTFSASSHATITAAEHGFATKGLAVMVYSPSGSLLAPNGNGEDPIVVDPATRQVDVYFTAPTTFFVVIHGEAAANLTGISAIAPLTAGTTIGPGNLPVRTVCLPLGADNGPVMGNRDLGPQGGLYMISAPATIVEIDVTANAGTSAFVLQKNHAGAASDLTIAPLATAANGGESCSRTVAGVGMNAVCAGTLQNTDLAKGDWLQTKAGATSTGANRVSVCVTFTVN